MKTVKLNKNESTFAKREPDMRVSEEAWKDFPTNRDPIEEEFNRFIEIFGC